MNSIREILETKRKLEKKKDFPKIENMNAVTKNSVTEKEYIVEEITQNVEQNNQRDQRGGKS